VLGAPALPEPGEEEYQDDDDAGDAQPVEVMEVREQGEAPKRLTIGWTEKMEDDRRAMIVFLRECIRVVGHEAAMIPGHRKLNMSGATWRARMLLFSDVTGAAIKTNKGGTPLIKHATLGDLLDAVLARTTYPANVLPSPVRIARERKAARIGRPSVA